MSDQPLSDQHLNEQPLNDQPSNGTAPGDKPLTDIAFSEFDLHPALLAGLEAAGFSRCTPIQAMTLPVALPGGDVAGQPDPPVAQIQLGLTQAVVERIGHGAQQFAFAGMNNSIR